MEKPPNTNKGDFFRNVSNLKLPLNNDLQTIGFPNTKLVSVLPLKEVSSYRRMIMFRWRRSLDTRTVQETSLTVIVDVLGLGIDTTFLQTRIIQSLLYSRKVETMFKEVLIDKRVNTIFWSTLHILDSPRRSKRHNPLETLLEPETVLIIKNSKGVWLIRKVDPQYVTCYYS